jgi:hypothetical protein
MTPPEPEVHFELIHWLSSAELMLAELMLEQMLGLLLTRRGLSGCDGGLSAMTRELDIHLDWSLSVALSRSCTLSSLICCCRLIILGGVVGIYRLGL